MTNVLYFEGAGMDFYEGIESNVGNFRIRTSFKNLDGVQYYIELGRSYRYTNEGKNGRTLKTPKRISDNALHISALFKIVEGESDNENKNSIKKDHQEINKLDYTKEDITKWINENLNCNFDTIEVLNEYYGYRVHSDTGYNLMEDIELYHNRAVARKRAFEKVDQEYRTYLNEKYSKISLMKMEGDFITIRCYASDKALGNYPRIQTINISTLQAI